jgi:hypothetical protein
LRDKNATAEERAAAEKEVGRITDEYQKNMSSEKMANLITHIDQISGPLKDGLELVLRDYRESMGARASAARDGKTYSEKIEEAREKEKARTEKTGLSAGEQVGDTILQIQRILGDTRAKEAEAVALMIENTGIEIAGNEKFIKKLADVVDGKPGENSREAGGLYGKMINDVIQSEIRGTLTKDIPDIFKTGAKTFIQSMKDWFDIGASFGKGVFQNAIRNNC